MRSEIERELRRGVLHQVRRSDSEFVRDFGEYFARALMETTNIGIRRMLKRVVGVVEELPTALLRIAPVSVDSNHHCFRDVLASVEGFCAQLGYALKLVILRLLHSPLATPRVTGLKLLVIDA